MNASDKYCGDSRFPTEASFVSHFTHYVGPLRQRLVFMPLGEIPVNELDRALFVFRFGIDRFDCYRQRVKLTAYERQQLDEYVLRQFR